MAKIEVVKGFFMSELSWTSGPSRRRSVGESTKDRRPRLKALAAASAQERRRHEFIANQKQASRSRTIKNCRKRRCPRMVYGCNGSRFVVFSNITAIVCVVMVLDCNPKIAAVWQCGSLAPTNLIQMVYERVRSPKQLYQ